MEQKKYELHFAPLQGYTDAIFRNAFRRYFGGVDVFYTPFIRVERGGIRHKDIRDILPEKNTVECLIPQILPGSPDEFRLLTDSVIGQGYRSIDINLGCPFPLIAGKRKGSGMLPYPELMREVLSTIDEYPECQFSLKMRLGWMDVSECLNVVDLINSLRLCHVTIHARTGKQQYKGKANLEAFSAFSELCRLPLFYNGDIQTAADINSIIEKFPLLRGVSMGRGLLSSPLVGREFQTNETFSDEKRMSTYFAFHEELFLAYSEILQGESQLLMKMKSFWEYFLPTTDHQLLKRIKKANKIISYRESIHEIFKGI